ncbi:MAG: hypothetical protein NT013_00085 [Planctomycetia bacterium]|nr:hypothetical protein [Planctomycetia bacterium]
MRNDTSDKNRGARFQRARNALIRARWKRAPRLPSWGRRLFIASLLCAASLLFLSGCHAVPQVLGDEAVFKELDALYTAVTSQRRNLVDDCRGRLTKLHAEERLSDAGFSVVTKIITKTEQNEWADAAQHLYDFMRAQRKTKQST